MTRHSDRKSPITNPQDSLGQLIEEAKSPQLSASSAPNPQPHNDGPEGAESDGDDNTTENLDSSPSSAEAIPQSKSSTTSVGAQADATLRVRDMDAKYKQYKLPQQDVSVQNTMADLLQDVPGIMARLLAEEVIMIKDEISSREASTRLTPAFLLSALIGAGDIDQAKIFIQMFPDAKRMLEEFIVTAPRMRKPTTFLGTAGTEECKNGIKILHDLLGSHALDGDLFKMLNAKNPVILSEQEKEGLLKSFVIDYTNLDLAITPQIEKILRFTDQESDEGKKTSAFTKQVKKLNGYITAGAILNGEGAEKIKSIIKQAQDSQNNGDKTALNHEKMQVSSLNSLLTKHYKSTMKRALSIIEALETEFQNDLQNNGNLNKSGQGKLKNIIDAIEATKDMEGIQFKEEIKSRSTILSCSVALQTKKNESHTKSKEPAGKKQKLQPNSSKEEEKLKLEIAELERQLKDLTRDAITPTPAQSPDLTPSKPSVDTNAKSEFYTEIKNDLGSNLKAKIVDEQAAVGQENDSSKTSQGKSKTSKLSKTKTPKKSHSNFNNASNLTYEALSNILLSDVSVDSKNGSVSSTRRAVLSKSLPSPQDILTAKHQDTGDTPLHAAIKVVDLERVRIFLNAGFKLGVKNGEGKTALHLMIEKQLPLIVLERALQIEAQNTEHHGESVKEKFVRAFNIQDNEGNTPLHIAANNNITSYYAALVGAGADVTAKNKDGLTPSIVSQNAFGDIALQQMLIMGEIFSSANEANIDITTLKLLDINLLHYFRDFTSVKNSVGEHFIEAQGKLKIAEGKLEIAKEKDKHPEEALEELSKGLKELQGQQKILQAQLGDESGGLEELKMQKQTLESLLPNPQAEQQQLPANAVDEAAASTEKPENTIKKEIDALGDTVERKVLAELLTRLLGEYSKQSQNAAKTSEVKEILSLIAKLASYYVNDKVQNSSESAGINVFQIQISIQSIIKDLTPGQQSQKDLFGVVLKHIFLQQAKSQGESGVPSPQDTQKTKDNAILTQFITPAKTPETITAEAALERSINEAGQTLEKTTQELASVDGEIKVVKEKIALKTAINEAAKELKAAQEEMQVAELMRIAISKQDSAIDALLASPASLASSTRKKTLTPSRRSVGPVMAATAKRPSSLSTTRFTSSDDSALSANSSTTEGDLTTFSPPSENYTIPEETGENDLQNNVGQEAASTEDCKKQMTTVVNLLPKPKTGLFSKAPKFDSAEFNEALTQLIEMGGINTTITQSTKRGKDVERGILHIIIRRLGSLDKGINKQKKEKGCLIEAFNKIYNHHSFHKDVVSSSNKSIQNLVDKMGGDKNCQQALKNFIDDAAKDNGTRPETGGNSDHRESSGSIKTIDPRLVAATSQSGTTATGARPSLWSQRNKASTLVPQEEKESQATAVAKFYTKLEEILNVEGNPSQEQLTQLGSLANIPDAGNNIPQAIGAVNNVIQNIGKGVVSIETLNNFHSAVDTINKSKLADSSKNKYYQHNVALNGKYIALIEALKTNQDSNSHENDPSPDPHNPDAEQLTGQKDKGGQGIN